MCVHVHVSIKGCTCACVYVVCDHACMCSHLYVYTPMRTCLYAYCLYVYMRVMRTCLYAYMCMRTLEPVCILPVCAHEYGALCSAQHECACQYSTCIYMCGDVCLTCMQVWSDPVCGRYGEMMGVV